MRPAGGTDTGAAAGSEVVASRTALGREGSAELRLGATGVILFGGVGGERLAGAGTGTTMTLLPGGASSAVKKPVNNNNQHRSQIQPVVTHLRGFSFNKTSKKSKCVSKSFSLGGKKRFLLWLSWLLSQWRVTHTHTH